MGFIVWPVPPKSILRLSNTVSPIENAYNLNYVDDKILSHRTKKLTTLRLLWSGGAFIVVVHY